MNAVIEAAPPRGDDDLVGRCRRGEALAARELYEAHFDFVYRTACRLGTPRAEAEDVVQETFAVAFRKLDRFEGGKLTTWLYRICANIVFDHQRTRRVRQRLAWLFGAPSSEEHAQASPHQALEQREAEEEVRLIVAQLAPKKREVFVLFELEALSGEEIAERVGCPVQTVWTRLFHARKDFARLARQRSTIEDFGIGPEAGTGAAP